ncbi:hypothetical protein HZ994_18745 [Akkermansiaceae bacterium]|nr:hypothetical protein HZ994_18745 [Akkermansiaceae bacterium]
MTTLPLTRRVFPASVLAATVSMAMSLAPTAAADGEKMRLVCATSLEEDQELVLASRAEGGGWRELGKVVIRSSLTTDVLPAKQGELHLAVRKGGKLESICKFTFPADARHGLVFLKANTESKTYDAHFVDPEKAGFVKGSLLILNLSAHEGTVSLGAAETKVPAGERALAKPATEDNGMFQMQVSFTDESGNVMNCYDRYVSRNPNSRDMLLLLPSAETGIMAMTLPLFGEFE